jgi:hypothetical protein
MLPRDRAEQIMAEHAAGKPVRAIARTYGHSPGTVRDYVHGRRAPGEPAARADDFAPYITYCRQRLADDPHLRAGALLAEITGLGFPAPSGRSTGHWNGTRSSRTPARTATSRESAGTTR